MSVKKSIYIVIGCMGLGLGAFGAAVPLLPSVPFLMLAAICFGKSSNRLNNWFCGTKLYKNNLESYVAGQGMTWKTKIRIMTMVTLTMVVGFVMMSNVPTGRMVLACVWLFHVIYFCLGVKTLTKDGVKNQDEGFVLFVSAMIHSIKHMFRKV